MNYFPFHVGDYVASTAHLSWDEDMAYTRLIRSYYQTEKPIPKEKAYRLARATTPSQRAAVDSVLDEFFILDADGYHQKRCDEEIAKFSDKQNKAKRSANARWKPDSKHSEGNANASETHMRTHSEGNADAMLTNNQEPITNNQIQKEKEKEPQPPVPGFDVFWETYPKKVARPAALTAFKKAKLNGHLPDVLKDIEEKSNSEAWTKNKGQFIPNPATYLNQRRWEDADDGTAQSSGILAGAI